jgi:hypothetical protein
MFSSPLGGEEEKVRGLLVVQKNHSFSKKSLGDIEEWNF